MGGAHHALGLGGTSEGAGAIAFQPLRSIDRADERAWAAEWVAVPLAPENVSITPQVTAALWSPLTNLATAPLAARSLTVLALLLTSPLLRTALASHLRDAPFVPLLDPAGPAIA